MDKNRIGGSVDQMKGGVKEKAGRALGDQKLESEGTADKLGGKVKSAVGGIADSIRDIGKKGS